MNALTLNMIVLFLRNLFEERKDALLASRAGQLYAPGLEQLRVEIDALPPELTGGRPLSEELNEADGQHDGVGSALYFLVEAVVQHPDIGAEIKGSARRVREAFVPRRKELQASYVVEAAQARKRRPKLVELKTDLEAVPTPGAGTTALDWATRYVELGEHIDQLINTRAVVTPESREQASTLRAKAVAIVGRFRETLADDLAFDPELPRDLEKSVFGYLDELVAG